ncbi:MAG: IS1/IS1595 family N-terminal zinc-binding domain-containing protein [Thermodesulfobacteriota bacterium]
MESPITCPRCQGDAVNKYGRTAGGKQRYICLVCSRQFVKNSLRQQMADRPDCPACGEKMHIYRTQRDLIRYRCSNYPHCRGFAKVESKTSPKTSSVQGES